MRGFCLFFGVFALVSTAQASDFDDGLTHFQRGEVEEAQRAFEAARAAGELDPAAVARVERYLGIVYASLGEDARALQSFERSLAVDPEQATPTEIGPEQQAFFETARRSAEALDVAVSRQGEGYMAELIGAPAGWVATTVVSFGAREVQSDGPQVEFAPNAAEWLADRLPVRIVARDEFGNVVHRGRAELERTNRGEGRGRGRAIGIGIAAALVVAGGVVAAILLTRGDDGFSSG
ncbi:MAG: tetratricopeptide repeat protein, partial [Myxococcota bacterium]